MIRTRNFFLFVLLVAFLIGGILLTLWFSASTVQQEQYADMIFGGDNTATMTAEVVTPEDTRQSRLASLRAKLAKYTDVAMAPSVEEVSVETTNSENATTTDEAPGKATADVCANYGATAVPALNGQLTYGESGGQRTFGTVGTTEPTGSSTVPATTVATVFVLPLRTTALPSPSCIASDIVAVTPTGSPIRNTDYAKYRGVGEATLIGYTIDGFELYGASSNLQTDACGGTTVSGVYRYYLSSERDTVLNCFAAIPVAL
ncbi:hypothetical protein K2P47_02850 [Patescibacteria group bacterium]|nr:hypothetical protein [Patescibacteria group bacterium]